MGLQQRHDAGQVAPPGQHVGLCDGQGRVVGVLLRPASEPLRPLLENLLLLARVGREEADLLKQGEGGLGLVVPLRLDQFHASLAQAGEDVDPLGAVRPVPRDAEEGAIGGLRWFNRHDVDDGGGARFGRSAQQPMVGSKRREFRRRRP